MGQRKLLVTAETPEPMAPQLIPYPPLLEHDAVRLVRSLRACGYDVMVEDLETGRLVEVADDGNGVRAGV